MAFKSREASLISIIIFFLQEILPFFYSQTSKK